MRCPSKHPGHTRKSSLCLANARRPRRAGRGHQDTTGSFSSASPKRTKKKDPGHRVSFLSFNIFHRLPNIFQWLCYKSSKSTSKAVETCKYAWLSRKKNCAATISNISSGLRNLRKVFWQALLHKDNCENMCKHIKYIWRHLLLQRTEAQFLMEFNWCLFIHIGMYWYQTDWYLQNRAKTKNMKQLVLRLVLSPSIL